MTFVEASHSKNLSGGEEKTTQEKTKEMEPPTGQMQKNDCWQIFLVLMKPLLK